MAPHAGDAPTPTVRQTVMLLLQQWGSGFSLKLVAAPELHRAFLSFKQVLSYVS